MKKVNLRQVKILDSNVFNNYRFILDKSLTPNDKLVKRDINEIAKKIINIELSDTNLEIELENLFIELIRKKNKSLSKDLDWEKVCKKCAVIYTKTFNNEKFRSLRTKSVRNIYLIREIIEKNQVVINKKIQTEKVDLFTWDFRESFNKKIFITCDKKNLTITSNNETKEYIAGLPTQIDILSDGSISIGSSYSKGFFFYKKNGHLTFKDIPLPVITTFFYENNFFFLQKNGELFKNYKIFFKVSHFSSSICKARFINPFLIIMDWSKLNSLLIVNMKTLRREIIKLPEIYIPNDICEYGGNFYIIDKLQGQIFSYNKSFKFRKKILSFGQGSGELYDPISIFSDGKKLNVVSWLNKYIVRLLPF